MIKDRLGAKPLVMQIPIGIEASLQGVVDLVKMKAIVCKNEDLGAEWEEKDIPNDLKETCDKYRQELVETAVEQDEKLMEAYLGCLLYTSPSPRDRTRSRMPSSA